MLFSMKVYKENTTVHYNIVHRLQEKHRVHFAMGSLSPKDLNSSFRAGHGSEQLIMSPEIMPFSIRPLAKASAICPDPMNPTRFPMLMSPTVSKVGADF